MRAARVPLLPIALVAMLLASCSSSDPDGSAATATSTTSTTSATSAGSSTTTAVTDTVPATTGTTDGAVDQGSTTTGTSTSTTGDGVGETGPVNEAEAGLRFDIGVVTETGSTGGTRWIRFDRYQFFDLQGSELAEEPRYELATDACCRNDNPALRTYVLAEEAEVLRIDPTAFEAVCGGAFDHPWDFQAAELDPLLADGGVFASLTFDDDRRVVRIREQTGC